MASRAPRASKTTLPPLEPQPATILDGLCRRFPRVSRETWVDRMDRGLVTDGEGRALAPTSPYVPHQEVRYFREVEEEPSTIPGVEILHVDDHLVVADKPPFLPVVPGGGFVRACLLYLLEERLGLEDLAPVHRLDRQTAGVVLFARKPKERGAYAALFSEGRIERQYEALAEVPEEPAGTPFTVESRIVRGTPFFRMEEVPGEPNARTEVELLGWRGGVGHFRLRPATGKKHQLRLHMTSLGWPILGDRLYPELLPEAPDDPDSALRLLAKELAFTDPVTGASRRFRSHRDLAAGTAWRAPTSVEVSDEPL